jgi:hypothetical protein
VLNLVSIRMLAPPHHLQRMDSHEPSSQQIHRRDQHLGRAPHRHRTARQIEQKTLPATWPPLVKSTRKASLTRHADAGSAA